jgi:hypothetical protein
MSKSFKINGLDEYTKKMITRLEKEYPKQSKKFMEDIVTRCKNEAIERTPVRKKGKSRGTKKKWKQNIYSKKGHCFGVVKNSSKMVHLIESGHMAENGTWVEGAHMLENTMTNQQPKIDRAIDSFIDEMLNF